jgi:serine/threonine-protein kinase
LRSLLGTRGRGSVESGGTPWLYAPNPGYLQPGTKIGAYEVAGLVGSGGFGFVYRVTRDSRPYALKISKWRGDDLDVEERGESEKRLDREISALMSFRHPNIVRVHGFERWPSLEDGYPYLVMDFVEGDHLNEWRKKTSPSLRLACEAVASIADALAYIHRCGVFHRDLKSENVLVRRSDGAPVIVDFGISRLREADPVTRIGYSLGTITHYAPEYAEFVSSPSFVGLPFEWRPETDLHALGYIFYELLTGHAPFPKASRAMGEAQLLHIIRTHVPAAPSVRTSGAVPAPVDEIVMRLLAKKPGDRFASADVVAQAIRLLARDGGAAWDEPLQLPTEDLATTPTPRWAQLPPGSVPRAPTPNAATPRVPPPAEAAAPVQPQREGVPRRRSAALTKVLLGTVALVLLGILGYEIVAPSPRLPQVVLQPQVAPQPPVAQPPQAGGAPAPVAAEGGRAPARAPSAPTQPRPDPVDKPAGRSKEARPVTESALATKRPAVANVRLREERLEREREAKLARERAAQKTAEREQASREQAAHDQAAREAAEREKAEAREGDAAEDAQDDVLKPGLGKTEIRSVVSSAKGSFERCIETERQTSAKSRQVKLDGRRVMLRINIQPNGKVSYPTFDDVTLKGTDLGTCIVNVAKGMTFPAVKGRTPPFDIPLVLRK